MQQWEYDVDWWQWKGFPANRQQLALKGAQGWELVSFYRKGVLFGGGAEVGDPEILLAVFKRPMPKQ